MRISTWNVNSINARLLHVQDYLNQTKPDVLLLQEIKTENFPKDCFEEMGYSCCVLGQKTYNGVAILAKGNIENPVYGLPGFQDPQARYLEAYVDGQYKVISVYVPNGQDLGTEKFAYKLRFLEQLNARIPTLLNEDIPWIMGGDFNIAPESIDVYDPNVWNDQHILCSVEERSLFRQLLHQGLTDCLRHCFPNHKDNLYTWWHYRQNGWKNNRGLRIDHLLLSSHAADLLIDSGIDANIRGLKRPSDHAPVWVNIDL